jgi:alkaline phosphatase D
LRYGDLADLIMIDTRLEGREEQPLLASDTLEYRTILGQEQLQWLRTRVNQSQAQWKIIGNQVIFSPFNVGFAAENPTSLEEITLLESIFVDIWDGYPKERRVLLNDLRDNPNSDNVVILTGDFHCSFAFDVPSNPVVYPNPLALNFPTPSPSYNPVTGEGSLAVEFATPSISSANFDENVTFETALTFQTVINANLPIGPPLGFVNYNPHMKYVDLIQHGYMLLDLTPAAAQADWYYVNILDPADNNETYGAGRLTLNGQNRLTNATGPAAGKAVAPPLAPAMPQTGSNAFNMPLSEQADAAAVALNVFPVPAVVGGELYLLLALNEPSPIRIELLDMSGKVVRSFGESQRSGGTYTFTLPLENTMSPGFYLLRIAAAGNTITRKVMVE